MYSSIEACVSSARLATYRLKSGFDEQRALDLYYWNMEISASFYPLLASVEVCLRNIILRRMIERFGEMWWANEALYALLQPKGKGILLRASREIEKRGNVPDSGRMVAELSFGFWTNMLLPKYDAVIWSAFNETFKRLPHGKSRGDLFDRATRIRELRNRISHHEPIIGRNLSQDYADTIEFLGWLHPEKAKWLRPRLSIMSTLRTRP
ncbi:Abi family protein [Sulfitobacter albidus]|uniref:Abi family protein n=1 Tax=Sulfitobacter albidus TaxID=2829501 RepID=A0A975JCQ7_9RHOB|nr:Abi family protein [Sulfitobacter albidus]QUJ76072.1 Abi family protein [Sulfitobacter albidus]